MQGRIKREVFVRVFDNESHVSTGKACLWAGRLRVENEADSPGCQK